MKPLRYIRWRLAWWRWLLWQAPVTGGRAIYGKGEQRTANLRHVDERWWAREPKRVDYL